MKKIVFILSMLMLVCVTMVSCKKDTAVDNPPIQTEDVEYVKECIDSINNPVFKNKTDFLNYVAEKRVQRVRDSILENVCIDVVAEIAEITMKKYGAISPKMFMREYLDNYDRVYRYMEPKTPPRDTIKVKEVAGVQITEESSTKIK